MTRTAVNKGSGSNESAMPPAARVSLEEVRARLHSYEVSGYTVAPTEDAAERVTFRCPLHRNFAGLDVLVIALGAGTWGCAQEEGRPLDLLWGHLDQSRQENEPDNRLRLYDVAELNAWAFTPPSFIVETLLPRVEVVVVGGPPKTCKSLLVLDLCLAIACGRARYAGKYAIQQRPRILYVSQEDGGARLKGRITDLLAARGETPPPAEAFRLLIQPSLDLADENDLAMLREACRKAKIELLVLDTLVSLTPRTDPLSAKDQTAVADRLTQLARALGLTIVIIDHTRKNRGDGQPIALEDLFGPVQKAGFAEHVIMLDKTADEKKVQVYVKGKDTEAERFFLLRSPEGTRGAEKFTHGGTLEGGAQAQRAKGQHHGDLILAALRTAGTALSAVEIRSQVETMHHVRLGKSATTDRLNLLKAGGWVTVEGDGKTTRYRAAGGTR